MPMKLSPLATYVDADEAATVIAFLDQVRDLLCHAYAYTYTDQIAQAQCIHRQCADDEQLDLDFGEREPLIKANKLRGVTEAIPYRRSL